MSTRIYEPDHLLWQRYALAMTAVLLGLGCFQSANMVALAYDLPENALSTWIVARAENWHGWMAQIGIADLVEQLAAWGEAVQETPLIGDDLDP